MHWAVFFPGQGSQSQGMLQAMAEVEPAIQARFDQASQILAYDAWALVQQGPLEQLNQTACTQPILLAADVAMWDAFSARVEHQPNVMLGHSLGEYSALVCAGSLDFADAVRLVALRGQAMQEAVPSGEGAMAAVLGLDDEAVEALCMQCAQGDVLSVANRNAVGQVVVAGEAKAVTRLVDAAPAAGAKRVVLLPVSVPSHCALMAPAQAVLRDAVAQLDVRMPTVPVWHNALGGVASDEAGIRAALVDQLVAPVPWVTLVQTLYAEGVRWGLECGPGKVLTGLNRRIERGLLTCPTAEPALFEKAVASWHEQGALNE